MSSEEETLRPAFADGGGWSGPGAVADDEYEVVEPDAGPLTLSLVRESEHSIVGRILNTGETVVLDSRPVVSFDFVPAELLKFDMPSVLLPKKEEVQLRLNGKASTQILVGTWKSSRWVFQWSSEDATRTHQSSYTLHPKGCEIVVTVEVFPGKPSLRAALKV